MSDTPTKYEPPSRRDMLLSLEARRFRSSWSIAVRCICGRD